jgi:hypothetical protein
MNCETNLAIKRADIAYDANYPKEKQEYWRFKAIVELLSEIIEKLDHSPMVTGFRSLGELRLDGSKSLQEPSQESQNQKV